MYCIMSGCSSSYFACTAAIHSFTRASRTFLSSVSMQYSMASISLAHRSSNRSSSKDACSYSNFGLPISLTILSMRSSTGCRCSCACTMPSYMTSSGTWSASDSIMTIFLCVAAMVVVMRLVLRCSCVGLKRYFSPSQPRTMPAMGPLNGTSEMLTAALAPIMAVISGLQSRSTDRTSQAMMTSLRRSLGKSGRIGRSIRRLASTAGRLGLPSRRIKLPGMRPTA